MKAQRLMSIVRENADLLKLLLDLAFLFCGLLQQVNTAVEGKPIGAIFAHFSVSVILFFGWPKFSFSSHSLFFIGNSQNQLKKCLY